uniref:Uncharacterized protein n=1 Tax=Oryza sativa subsp. japonica TaxID=39947 RepID=Q6H5I8_ORYSJ|nr:hypothetical protein [Oryza sativa Japonica Group]
MIIQKKILLRNFSPPRVALARAAREAKNPSRPRRRSTSPPHRCWSSPAAKPAASREGGGEAQQLHGLYLGATRTGEADEVLRRSQGRRRQGGLGRRRIWLL